MRKKLKKEQIRNAAVFVLFFVLFLWLITINFLFQKIKNIYPKVKIKLRKPIFLKQNVTRV